jgi:hypothetical protein
MYYEEKWDVELQGELYCKFEHEATWRRVSRYVILKRLRDAEKILEDLRESYNVEEV